MKRLTVLLCAASAGLLPGSVHAAIVVPPDLAALEQQMAQLQANSERFSFQEELSFGRGLLGQGSPLVLIVAGDGEASDAPAQSVIRAGLLGIDTEQARLLGETSYRYKREAASIDGGRPWVRSRHMSERGNDLDPAGILENDKGGKQGTFSGLVELINGALAIEESGPTTVDDQRVVEFDATLDPTALLRKLESQSESHSKRPRHPLDSPLRIPSVGGPNSVAKPGPPPMLKLELFIAANGLPVRARLVFAAEGVSLAIRVDTLAINVPVHVLAPPARQTIDAASLKRLEKQAAARELARARRACRRLRGKRALSCRRLSRIGSSSSEPESSLF